MMANTNFDPDELFTEQQTATKLKHSPRTLQGWRRRGEGPHFIKSGRSVRYRAGDLAQWIANNRARSTAEVDARS